MANIAEYDAKIYFWGMVLFATVSFIALPAVAFIYLDNKILSEQIKIDRKKTEQLKQKIEDQLRKDSNASNRGGNRIESNQQWDAQGSRPSD